MVDIIVFNAVGVLAIQLFLLFISICIHCCAFKEMFASFVNDVDNAADGEMKTEAFRKLIEFHMDIKEYACTDLRDEILCYFIY